MDRDEQLRIRIRESAYLKWERAGRPRGKSEEYWLEAERELAEQTSRVEQSRDMSRSADTDAHADRPTDDDAPECDVVQVASEESFPASDSPGWIGRT